MSTLQLELNPKTAKALKRFGIRRKTLQAIRGIFETGFIILLSINIVTLFDFIFILSDFTRYVLSIASYLTMISALYFLLIRPLIRKPNMRDLARLFDERGGMGSEEVLSAVEFSEDPAGAELDSPEFRAILQNQVASGVSKLKTSKLLPWKMILRWAIALGIFLFIFIILLSMDSVHYTTRLARALFPHKNIARISLMKVNITKPNLFVPVPLGEPANVQVSLSKPTDKPVFIETYTTDQEKSEKFAMRKEQDLLYSSEINIPTEAVSFRIFAGDAITKWYTIEAKRRPHVSGFIVTYEYPDYTGLQPVTHKSEAGDLSSLTGTRAKLELLTKPAVQEASLQIAIDESQLEIPLEMNAQGNPTGYIDMVKPGTYKINLTSEVAPNTYFENKFSPYYEINIIKDLTPQVEITKPVRNMIVLPDQIIDVAGSAKDDYGLDRVSQIVRINSGPWEPTVLDNNVNTTTTQISNTWNLGNMDLNGGDYIYVRLAAMDNKGSLGESKIIRLKVMDFQTVQEREEFQEQLEKNQQEMNELAQDLEDLQEMAEKMQQDYQDNDPQAQQQLQQTQQKTQEVQQQAQELSKELQKQANDATDMQTRQDLNQMAELAEQIAQDPLQQAHEQMDQAKQEQEPQENVDQAKEDIDEAQQMAQQMAEANQQMQQQQQMQLTQEQMEMLAQMQEQLRQETQETQDFEEMAQQEQQLMEQQEQLEQDLQEMMSAEEFQQMLEQMMEQMQQQQSSEEMQEQMQQAMEQMQQARQEIQQQAQTPSQEMMPASEQMQQALQMMQQQMQQTQMQMQMQMQMQRQLLAQMTNSPPPPPNNNPEDAFDQPTPDDSNQLPQIAMDDEDWHVLRSGEAENVMQNKRESVGEDYQGMVGAYFQALSKKAGKE